MNQKLAKIMPLFLVKYEMYTAVLYHDSIVAQKQKQLYDFTVFLIKVNGLLLYYVVCATSGQFETFRVTYRKQIDRQHNVIQNYT